MVMYNIVSPLRCAEGDLLFNDLFVFELSKHECLPFANYRSSLALLMKRYLHWKLLLLFLLLQSSLINPQIIAVLLLIKIEYESFMPDRDLLVITSAFTLDRFLVSVWVGTLRTVEQNLSIYHHEIISRLFADYSNAFRFLLILF